MRLKDSVSWNQVPRDWHGFIELEPDGCFVGEKEGRVVATTTTINYENRMGWIGMVLVDPDFQRQGIATRLISHAIDYLESIDCRCQKLDATELGSFVYQRFDFTTEYPVERWRHPHPSTVRTESLPNILPWESEHLDSIVDFDQTAFGASRAKLLAWYGSNDAPKFVSEAADSTTGYVAGRRGSWGWQLGPCVANDGRTARALMGAFLAQVPSGPAIVDTVADNYEAIQLLEEFGFKRHRRLHRMCRGGCPAGTVRRIFGLAGFEFG